MKLKVYGLQLFFNTRISDNFTVQQNFKILYRPDYNVNPSLNENISKCLLLFNGLIFFIIEVPTRPFRILHSKAKTDDCIAR